MSTTDPFRMTAQLDQSLLQVIGARLEARGNHPRFATMLQEYLDAMHIDTAQTVLDMGCGTGVAARHRAAPGVCRSSLFKDAADGVFFGASNYYSYVAKRPQAADYRQALPTCRRLFSPVVFRYAATPPRERSATIGASMRTIM